MGKRSSDNQAPGKEHLLSRQRMREILILSLLIVSVYGAFRIVAPYLHAIILAALIAYLFSPVHRWVLSKMPKRQNLAAFITCILVGLTVVVPLLGFASTLVYRGVETFASVQAWVERAKLEEINWTLRPKAETEAAVGLSEQVAVQCALHQQAAGSLPATGLGAGVSTALANDWLMATFRTHYDQIPRTQPSTPEARKIEAMLHSAPVRTMLAWKSRFFPTLEVDGKQIRNWLFNQSETIVSYLSDKAVGGVRNAVLVLTNFLLMLFVMFYLFRDGSQIMGYIEQLSPLTPEQERMLIERVQTVSKSAISGTFLTGIAQGILGMIAFAITGIPWLVWGVMLGFASLIPVVGTALVWVPCVIYLFIIGSTYKAVFLALWCIIVVGLADNLLRPFLMQGKVGMSSMLLFFSILGGLQLFGLVGVIYGPLIFGLCAVMLYIFKLETAERLKARQNGEESEPEDKTQPTEDSDAADDSEPTEESDAASAS